MVENAKGDKDVTTEFWNIDTFIKAPIDKVVAFLTDFGNVKKFAFGREKGIEIEFLSRQKIRVNNALTKTETIIEYKQLRTEKTALVDIITYIPVEGEKIVYIIFLLIREWGEESHVLFGWYNTPEVKEYLKKARGWAEFDSDFIKSVSVAELAKIKELVEEDNK